MKYVFPLTLFYLVSFSNAQTAEQYFELAKEAYPDYKKTIGYLNKAVFKDINNISYQFIRAKIKILSGDKVLISHASKELNKIKKEDPYIKCWSYYADICKSGKVNFISPAQITFTDNSILSFYIDSNISTYAFYNKNNKGNHIDKLFDNFDKGIYDFPTLITCFRINYRYSKWSEYKQKIIDSIVKYPIEKLKTEVDVFSPKSLPIFKTPNQHNMTQSGSFMGKTSNFLNEFEIIKGIAKRPKFAKKILRFEKYRKKLSLPSYEALHIEYPNFYIVTYFLMTFIKLVILKI